MKSCWINKADKIQSNFRIHCYDSLRTEDVSSWMTIGRYIPLTVGLLSTFENLTTHPQPPQIIQKMNRLIQLEIESNEFHQIRFSQSKFHKFEVINDLILDEFENLTQFINENRLYYDRLPKDVSENLPILSPNHGVSGAILHDLKNKGKDPDMVIIIDGHFDFYAMLSIPTIYGKNVDKNIDVWAKTFGSRRELIEHLQQIKQMNTKQYYEVNRADWLRDCFFSMPKTKFLHIGANYADKRFVSNTMMRKVFKMDTYPHLYDDFIKWSKTEVNFAELKDLIEDKNVYLSIDVDGISEIPNTYSLAEPKTKNQISRITFEKIIETVRKYANEIQFDISELSLHEDPEITSSFLKKCFTTLYS